LDISSPSPFWDPWAPIDGIQSCCVALCSTLHAGGMTASFICTYFTVYLCRLTTDNSFNGLVWNGFAVAVDTLSMLRCRCSRCRGGSKAVEIPCLYFGIQGSWFRVRVAPPRPPGDNRRYSRCTHTLAALLCMPRLCPCTNSVATVTSRGGHVCAAPLHFTKSPSPSPAPTHLLQSLLKPISRPYSPHVPLRTDGPFPCVSSRIAVHFP
jgi:hypothetical protein